MKRHGTLILALVTTVLMSQPVAHGQSAPDMLEQGIFTEETLGDLDTAIEIYEQIVAEAEENRSYAAQAQYRMGVCYLKKGQNQKAIGAFRKLIDRFPDQTTPITQAKNQLAALGQPISTMVTRQVWAPALDTMGRPSPDGRYLSYVNWTKGNLALHDLTTGENRDLTDEGTWESPSRFSDVSIWSPDGRSIAYCWIDTEAGTDLRIVGLDGSTPRIVHADPEKGYAWPRDWSQDGKQILAIFCTMGAAVDTGHIDKLALVSVADGTLRFLKTLGEQHPDYMSLSPDARYVAIESITEPATKARDIVLLATDGTGEVPLVDHPADDWAPFWTPDGKRIVFLSNRSGADGLWVLDVDGNEPKGAPVQVMEIGSHFWPMGFDRNGSLYYHVGIPRRDVYIAAVDFQTGEILTSPEKLSRRFEGLNQAAAWSPDGQTLAYVSGRNGKQVLVFRSIETGEERDLTLKSERISIVRKGTRPVWSPDGGSLLVTGFNQDKGPGLYLIDIGTGDAGTIVEQGSRTPGDPDWPVFSKDGKEIYFVRDRTIVAHDRETEKETELYRSEVYVHGLHIAPDGQQLAFIETGKDVLTVLKTMPVTGGEASEIYRLPEGQRFSGGMGPAWTPDGHHLIVGAPKECDEPTELWSIPSTGGEPRKLDLGVRGRQLSLHPDGRRLSLTVGKVEQEVWMIENFLPELSAAR